MGEQRRPVPARRSSDLLSLGSFVVLGLPDGMLGTAWPSMRATFGAPVGDLGLVLLLATAGSVLVTAFVGPLIRRLGVPTLLAVAGLLAALGYAGYAVAPGLWLVLGVSVLLGASAGMMDGGLNTAVALTGRQRLLNLLHGAYGVGTALGPLVVTAAILTGSWRPAYLTLVCLDLVMAVLWLRQRQRERRRDHRAAGCGSVTAAGTGAAAPVRAHPGPPRRAAGARRHLLAGGRGRRRGSGPVRGHRPAHRHHQPGRPRPRDHRPGPDRRRHRTDPEPPRPHPATAFRDGGWTLAR
jgi:MFS family permease